MKNAHAAPALSAMPINAPPCSVPTIVRFSAFHGMVARTPEGSIEVNSTPNDTANGINVETLAGVISGPASAGLLLISSCCEPQGTTDHRAVHESQGRDQWGLNADEPSRRAISRRARGSSPRHDQSS